LIRGVDGVDPAAPNAAPVMAESATNGLENPPFTEDDDASTPMDEEVETLTEPVA
jgi:hypothetical protein